MMATIGDPKVYSKSAGFSTRLLKNNANSPDGTMSHLLIAPVLCLVALISPSPIVVLPHRPDLLPPHHRHIPPHRPTPHIPPRNRFEINAKDARVPDIKSLK